MLQGPEKILTLLTLAGPSNYSTVYICNLIELVLPNISGDSSFLWLLGLDINSVKKTVKKAIK